MATWQDVFVYSIAAGIGTIGIALTGFGMAIVYLFVYQMAVLIGGYRGDFKYAIFIQAIALLAAQPWLLRIAKVRIHAEKRMLMHFVPATIVSTPLGQIAARYISTEWIEAVGGLLVLMVASFEVSQRREDIQKLFSFCFNRNGNTPAEKGAHLAPNDLSATAHFGDNSSDDVELSEAKSTLPSSSSPPSARVSFPNAEKSIAHDIETVNNQRSETQVQEQDTIVTKIGPLTPWARFCTISAGFSSGFLGALAGIRGPPVIIYFLYPPSGMVFSKESQRASAATMTAVNVLMRTLYYIIDTVALDGESYFDLSNDWYLYLSVVISGIVGVMVGAALFERTKHMKQTIRTVLTGLLFVCGTSLLLSSFAAVN